MLRMPLDSHYQRRRIRLGRIKRLDETVGIVPREYAKTGCGDADRLVMERIDPLRF